jgi:hypothetical protein
MLLAVYLIVAVPACVVAALLARAYWYVWALRLRGRSTVGTIVETWVDTAQDDDGRYERRYAMVAFETPQGLQRQRVRLSDRTVAVVGQQLSLRYDAADPSNISPREPRPIFKRVLAFFVGALFELWTVWSIVSTFLFVILLGVWLFWR